MPTPLLCLIGPTATGKSALAMAIGQVFNIEIISVDSALVYQHMDIGTAKPSLAQRSKVRHHLIDIIEPTDSYSVAQFCRDVQVCVSDILTRGKIPLLVGGTMLYIRALESGLAKLPNANLEIRKKLNEEARKIGWQLMHQKLQQIDPMRAYKIAPSDSQRIQRALEVYETSGSTMSSLIQEQGLPFFKLHKLCLMPSSRQWLKDEIAQRFHAMVEKGFLNEVSQLLEKYPQLTLESPAMKTVGYRQAYQYLQHEISYEAFLSKVIHATSQLAKRQLTWLKKMTRITAVNCQEKTTLLSKAHEWFTESQVKGNSPETGFKKN